MVPDVPRQIRIWHPTRNELDGIPGDTQEGDDVRVCQVFPHGDHLMQHLGISLAPEHEESVIKTHHLERLRVSAGVHSYTLNPYLRSPLIDASGSWREGNDREGT